MKRMKEKRKKGGNASGEKLALKEFSDLSGWSAPTFSREPRDESQAFAVVRASARSRNNCKEVN